MSIFVDPKIRLVLIFLFYFKFFLLYFSFLPYRIGLGFDLMELILERRGEKDRCQARERRHNSRNAKRWWCLLSANRSG